jgi:protein-disulfide isomerase
MLAGARACPKEGAPPAPSAGADGSGGSVGRPKAAQPDAKDIERLLPGIPLDPLTQAQRAVVAQVAQDEFCYCGCPHTLSGCLREHTTCRHAPKMAALAARMAGAGLTSGEIIKLLADYYASFDKAKRVKLDVTGYPAKGKETAPIAIVEYSDFTCPYCALARPMLEAFVKKQGGRVKLYYKPYPLAAHAAQHAFEAAEALEWAREKKLFWPMHDLLFDKNKALSPDNLASYGKQLGGDGEDLRRALATGRYKAKVQASLDEAKAAGVDGTPTLFFNGRRLTLPDISEPTLEMTLADEEEWQKRSGWARD